MDTDKVMEHVVKVLQPKAGDVLVVRGGSKEEDDKALYDSMAGAMAGSAIDPGVLVIFVGSLEAISRLDAEEMAEYGWAYMGEAKAKEWAASHYNPGE